MKHFILVGVLFILPLSTYAKALHYMTEKELWGAYAQGNIEAKTVLADRNYYGLDEHPKNTNFALALYEQAAADGNISAIQQMGSFYQSGEHSTHYPQSLSRSIELYEQALNIAIEKQSLTLKDSDDLHKILGNLFALYETGQYSSELFLSNGLALYKKTYGIEMNKKKYNLFKKTDEQREIKTLLKLADFETSEQLHPGLGRERRFLLMQAINLGSVEAMLDLAKDYRDGVGFAPQTKHTIKKAVKLYKQALLQGNSIEAAEQLAHIYRHGIKIKGVKMIGKNDINSRSFYQKAAELGSIFAMEQLAYIYKNGYLGVKPNLEKAVQYSVMSLEYNNSEWEYHAKRIKEKSISFLQQMAENGSAEASYQLGRLYERGHKVMGAVDRSYRQLVPKNQVLAVLFFERAAQQGHKEAQKFLRDKVLDEGERKANAFLCAPAFAT